MLESDEKNRILNVASERFLESGITKVTLDEIAADLGMSKKTVYKFFPSKSDLLQVIVRMLLSHVEREVSSIVNANEPFEKKIARILSLIGRQVRRFSRQFQIDMQKHSPLLWKEIETFRRERIFSQVKKMFEQAKREKVFREDLNVDLFYLVFLSAVQGIMNPKTLSENSFSAEEAFKGIYQTLLEGALTEEAKKRAVYLDTN